VVVIPPCSLSVSTVQRSFRFPLQRESPILVTTIPSTPYPYICFQEHGSPSFSLFSLLMSLKASCSCRLLPLFLTAKGSYFNVQLCTSHCPRRVLSSFFCCSRLLVTRPVALAFLFPLDEPLSGLGTLFPLPPIFVVFPFASALAPLSVAAGHGRRTFNSYLLLCHLRCSCFLYQCAFLLPASHADSPRLGFSSYLVCNDGQHLF